MAASAARVSVGLPVYNGAGYLGEALESILSQTFEDFELIVSDNASTDATPEIVRRFAAADQRITHLRSDTNRGATWNYNRVYSASSGEYFKWAAHDDLLAPTFLESCMEVLDADPSVVLCTSKVTIIDETGRTLGHFDPQLEDAAASEAHVRFRNLVLVDRWCFDFFGLIRADALRRTRLKGSHIGADRTLRAELGLLGRFHVLPDHLFLSRDHPDRSVRALPAHHLRAEWFDPANAGKLVFPHWRILGEYARTVSRGKLDAASQARCYLTLARWVASDGNWARLGADVVVAVAPSSAPTLARLSRSEESWLRLSSRGSPP